MWIPGLFNPQHMQYELERDAGPNGEPSLAEMTDKAIRILSHNAMGYFLMVEGIMTRRVFTRILMHSPKKNRNTLTIAIATT